MYKRILVPLDGSTRAERSIPLAAHIARATNGTVVLVQIASLPFTYSPYLGSATYADEAIETDLKEVERYLNTNFMMAFLHNLTSPLPGQLWLLKMWLTRLFKWLKMVKMRKALALSGAAI